MLMEKTEYRIEKARSTYSVTHKDDFVAFGFSDVESALKAVHVLEGRIAGDFYTETDGVVIKNTSLTNKG